MDNREIAVMEALLPSLNRRLAAVLEALDSADFATLPAQRRLALSTGLEGLIARVQCIERLVAQALVERASAVS